MLTKMVVRSKSKSAKKLAKNRQMSGLFREFRFVVDAYTPGTFPMGRLGEYLVDLAKVVGEQDSVHFDRLEAGSTQVVHRVQWEAVPKVRERIRAVRHREAPREALDAFDAINERLLHDNASGRLVESDGRKVIEFPGVKTRQQTEYGPFSEAGTLTGVVIGIGGKNDPVSVHLEDGEILHYCHAKREVAKMLAPHLFGTPVRVSGLGRWHRDAHGDWEMKDFRIQSFTTLDASSLGQLVQRLRGVKGSWKNRKDPLADIAKLREG